MHFISGRGNRFTYTRSSVVLNFRITIQAVYQTPAELKSNSHLAIALTLVAIARCYQSVRGGVVSQPSSVPNTCLEEILGRSSNTSRIPNCCLELNNASLKLRP